MSTNTQNNNQPVTNEVTDEMNQKVIKEKNNILNTLNQKVFKGKLATWLAVFGIATSVATFVTPIVTPIVTSLTSGEEKKQEQPVEILLEQQEKRYEDLLDKLEEVDKQEDAYYELQIDLLKEELEEIEKENQELEDKLEKNTSNKK